MKEVWYKTDKDLQEEAFSSGILTKEEAESRLGVTFPDVRKHNQFVIVTEVYRHSHSRWIKVAADEMKTKRKTK